MPIIDVTLVRGRSPQEIRAMISGITDAVVEAGVAPRTSVRIIVREIEPDHFAAADVTIAERRATESRTEESPTEESRAEQPQEEQP